MKLRVFMYIVVVLFLFNCENSTAPQEEKTSDNHPPIINSFTADKDTIEVGEKITFTIDADDRDGDELNYTWYEKDVDGEDWVYEKRKQNTIFTLIGKTPKIHTMYCIVGDENEGETEVSVNFTVIEAIELKANFVVTGFIQNNPYGWGYSNSFDVSYEIENIGEDVIWYFEVYFTVTYIDGSKYYDDDIGVVVEINEKRDCEAYIYNEFGDNKQVVSVEIKDWILYKDWEYYQRIMV